MSEAYRSRGAARALVVLVAMAVSLLVPMTPSVRAATDAPLWRGDFETGDFSQWDGLNGNRSTRYRHFAQWDLLNTLLADQSRYFGIVASPTAQGRYAFRSTVDANATERDQAGQRSMLLLFPDDVPHENTTGAFEGSERWYRTSVYFPSDFRPSPDSTWNWVVQWHNWPDGPCCPNLAIAVDSSGGAEKLSLRVMGGGNAANPIENDDVITETNPAGYLEWFVGDRALKRDHWYSSLVHVKWSADPDQGLVEWWLDGRRVVSRAAPTLYWYADNNSGRGGSTPGPGQAYYMEGYYRPDRLPDNADDGRVDTSSATVYFDGAQIGATASAVTP